MPTMTTRGSSSRWLAAAELLSLLLLLLLASLSLNVRTAAATVDVSCGGVYKSASGSIQFQGTYDGENQEPGCSYLFVVPHFHQLTINIDGFKRNRCDHLYGHSGGSSRLEIFVEMSSNGFVLNRTIHGDVDALHFSTGNVRMDFYVGNRHCDNTFKGSYTIEKLESWKINETVANKSMDVLATASCENGGGRVESTGSCACPPGFAGQNCEKACGWDRYGADCETTCSDSTAGCKGKIFCAGVDFCTCASGLKGSFCDEECGDGYYGANCLQRCGRCTDKAPCNSFTGACEKGCLPGFLPPTCHHELMHLKVAPTVTATKTSLNVSIPLDPTERRGRGDVLYYQVQYKLVDGDGDGWVASALGLLEKASSSPSGAQHIIVHGLPADTNLEVRVLLLDESMQGFDRLPTARVRTGGKRRIKNLRATDLTARSVRLDWESHDFKQGDYFFVKRKCLSLVACSTPCTQPDAVVPVAGLAVLLDGLLPAARYRVTVLAAENHEQSVVFTTPTLVPDAGASSLRVAAQTNNSALLEWATAAECERQFGATAGFVWRLSDEQDDGKDGEKDVAAAESSSSSSSFSMATSAVLTGLQPLHRYGFSVSLHNQDGACPANRVASLNFTTLHTVPDPPGQLAVYRLNRTALWLRWRPPARPSGKLRFYLVRVESLSADSAAPGSAGGASNRLERTERLAVGSPGAPSRECAAWPGFVCHVVGRLKPRARYALTVSAVNEHGDLPGEEASVEATTTKGVSEPPQALRLVSAGARSATVSWSLPSLLHADLTYFEVAVTRLVRADEESADADVEDPDPQRYPVTEERPSYQYVVKGLQPGASYSITVACGFSGRHARIEVTTTTDEDEDGDGGASDASAENVVQSKKRSSSSASSP